MISFSTQNGYEIKIPTKFHGYQYDKLLGIGSTSVVLLIENEKSHEKYSSKVISKTDVINRNMYGSILREINVQKSISHPNIIEFKESFELKNEDEEYIFIVMEYCENGDLLKYASNYGFKSETIKKKIIRDFLRGIQYLHSKEISHGDIKAENILLDSHLNAKLCDFGYCRTRIRAGDENKNGTLFYSAPELFCSGPFNTLKSDIYAIGITLYSITELEFPFDDGSDQFIIRQIVSGRLTFNSGIDKNLKKLIEKCTDLDPNRRPSVDEILNDDYLCDRKKSLDDIKMVKNNKIVNDQIQIENEKFRRKWNFYRNHGDEFESSDSDF